MFRGQETDLQMVASDCLDSNPPGLNPQLAARLTVQHHLVLLSHAGHAFHPHCVVIQARLLHTVPIVCQKSRTCNAAGNGCWTAVRALGRRCHVLPGGIRHWLGGGVRRADGTVTGEEAPDPVPRRRKVHPGVAKQRSGSP